MAVVWPKTPCSLVLAALERATEKADFKQMRASMEINPELAAEFGKVIKSPTVSSAVRAHVREFLGLDEEEESDPEPEPPTKRARADSPDPEPLSGDDVDALLAEGPSNEGLEDGEGDVSYAEILSMFGPEGTLLESPASPPQEKRTVADSPPDTVQSTRISEYFPVKKRQRADGEKPVVSKLFLPARTPALVSDAPLDGVELPDPIEAYDTIEAPAEKRISLWDLQCREDPAVAMGDVKRVTFPFLPPYPPVRPPGKFRAPPRVWAVAQWLKTVAKPAFEFEHDPAGIETISLPAEFWA